MPSEDNVRNQT